VPFPPVPFPPVPFPPVPDPPVPLVDDAADEAATEDDDGPLA
jgi:hypothetical protein